METILVGDTNDKHEVGNTNCPACFGYNDPRPCKCGGLIHTSFGDENYDGDYWLYEKCDSCGDNFEETE